MQVDYSPPRRRPHMQLLVNNACSRDVVVTINDQAVTIPAKNGIYARYAPQPPHDGAWFVVIPSLAEGLSIFNVDVPDDLGPGRISLTVSKDPFD